MKRQPFWRSQMALLIVQRLALAVLTMVLVSMLIFYGTYVLPGDVAAALLGEAADDSTLAAIRESLGLNVAAPLRYWDWLVALAHGDIGLSFANRRPVAPDLWVRLHNTLFLAGVTALVSVPIALALGIASAVWRNGVLDRVINIGGLTVLSLPEFFIGYLLILFLAVEMQWFPSLSTLTPGMGLGARLVAVALPVITLSLGIIVYILRMTRTAILSVMARPYIEMAILKGVSHARVVLVHALPTALAPIIQAVALNLAYMIVGVVLVEVVFVYPGIGQYLVDAVSNRDVNVVQACGLVFSATYIGINLVADILVIMANPRLRYPR